MTAGLPLRLHGRGWCDIAEFSGVSQGPITSHQQFLAAVGDATALVYTWPVRHAHPLDATGRPIVHRVGRRKESFIREATLALVNKSNTAPAANSDSISLAEALLKFFPAHRPG